MRTVERGLTGLGKEPRLLDDVVGEMLVLEELGRQAPEPPGVLQQVGQVHRA